jgi:hypothetical protein
VEINVVKEYLKDKAYISKHFHNALYNFIPSGENELSLLKLLLEDTTFSILLKIIAYKRDSMTMPLFFLDVYQICSFQVYLST